MNKILHSILSRKVVNNISMYVIYKMEIAITFLDPIGLLKTNFLSNKLAFGIQNYN